MYKESHPRHPNPFPLHLISKSQLSTPWKSSRLALRIASTASIRNSLAKVRRLTQIVAAPVGSVHNSGLDRLPTYSFLALIACKEREKNIPC